MAFDPDAYIAEKTKPSADGGFDPDAYIASKTQGALIAVSPDENAYDSTEYKAPTTPVASAAPISTQYAPVQPPTSVAPQQQKPLSAPVQATMPMQAAGAPEQSGQQQMPTPEKPLGGAPGLEEPKPTPTLSKPEDRAPALAVADVGLSMAAGMGASIVGGLAGAGRAMYGMATGEGFEGGMKSGADVSQNIQGMAYQPHTTIGKIASKAIGNVSDAANQTVGDIGGAVGSLIGPKSEAAGRAIGEAAIPVATTVAGGLGALKSAKIPPKIEAMTPTKEFAAEGQAKGYVLPPSQANPNLLNDILEGVSGKIKTAQGSSMKNQTVTNDLVRKALGIKEGAPISIETLGAIREVAGKSYENLASLPTPFKATKEFHDAIDSIGNTTLATSTKFPKLVVSDAVKDLKESMKVNDMTPREAVEISKILRQKATDNLGFNATGTEKALGRAYRDADKALGDMIEQNLKVSGQTKLLDEYRHNRILIAKTYSVEKALDAAGDVDANKLAAQLKKDPKKLTGELKSAAEFAGNFPKATKTPIQVGSHLPIDALDTLVAIGKGITTGGMVLARPAARGVILSKPWQKYMANASELAKDNSARNAAVTKSAIPMSTVVTKPKEKETPVVKKSKEQIIQEAIGG